VLGSISLASQGEKEEEDSQPKNNHVSLCRSHERHGGTDPVGTVVEVVCAGYAQLLPPHDSGRKVRALRCAGFALAFGVALPSTLLLYVAVEQCLSDANQRRRRRFCVPLAYRQTLCDNEESPLTHATVTWFPTTAQLPCGT
jgi:hypothetical protein